MEYSWHKKAKQDLFDDITLDDELNCLWPSSSKKVDLAWFSTVSVPLQSKRILLLSKWWPWFMYLYKCTCFSWTITYRNKTNIEYMHSQIIEDMCWNYSKIWIIEVSFLDKTNIDILARTAMVTRQTQN